MKKLIAAVCLFMATNVMAGQPPTAYLSLMINGVRFLFSDVVPQEILVNAKGFGKTNEEAVSNALVSAVQKGLGVLVVTDLTVKNEKIVRDLAATYSSGIVNSYEIKGCIQKQFIECEVDAKVSPWKFQRKLESDSSVVKVKGEDLAAQHMTAQYALYQRHKLIDYYFSQIRQSGVEIKIREVKILPTLNTNATLQVSYDIRWNPDFKKNMIKFLQRLEKESNEENYRIVIQWGPTGLFDNRAFINANNAITWNLINHHLLAPIDIRFEELSVCERHELKYDIFKIDWYQLNYQKQIEVPPNKLKGLQSITSGIGCQA